VLFIALARQRRKAELLLVLDGVESRARKRAERRGLVKMSVKAAEDPIEFGNSHGRAHGRAGGIFGEGAGQMSLGGTAVQREPGSRLELVFEECGGQAAGRTLSQRRNDRAAPVVIDDVEELVVLLREAVKAHARVVAPFDPRNACLAAFI